MTDKNLITNKSTQDSLALQNPWSNDFYAKNGINRYVGQAQIKADNDISAIGVWLERASSKHTKRLYKKEIERLLLWARNDLGKGFSDLQLEDLQMYMRFIQDPQPQEIWCNPNAKLPRKHPDWRPFSGKLSPKSQAQALRIIGSCFSFLVDASYLVANPCKLIQINKIATSSTNETVERYLEKDLWDLFWKFITNLPQETKREKNQKQRLLFLFQLLYHQSPRVSEVVNAKMNDFYKQHGKWWWKILGKGNKEASIPVHKKTIIALATYRAHLGLDEAVPINDNSPLIRSVNGNKSVTADMIYRLVKKATLDASVSIEKFDSYGAEKLKKASTHWFRHTSITHQADANVDIRYIQASARHSSITTTQKYLHHDIFKWHDAMDVEEN